MPREKTQDDSAEFGTREAAIVARALREMAR